MSIYHIKVKDKEFEYPEGTTFFQIAAACAHEYAHEIVLAKANGKLKELPAQIKGDCSVEFITLSDPLGSEAYRRSAMFLMLKAFADELGDGKTCPVRVEHSLSKGRFCTIRGMKKVSQELLARVTERMHALREASMPIRKSTIDVTEARNMFVERGMKDKYELFRFRQASQVNVYSLGDYCDYFYGYMVPDTSMIRWFALHAYKDGFVLQMPIPSAPEEVPPFEAPEKLYKVFTEARNWNAMMKTDTIADLNDAIVNGTLNELILLQEALQEKKIGDIAEMVSKREGVKFVLIAGPSSSGKTSFANRLSIQLRTQGMNPHLVSVDNYYLDRELIPKDENGDYDFECLEALDVKLLNEHLKTLLEGGEIHMPKYSFGTGSRTFREEPMRMEENDILVIEGIHCLNDKLTYDIPKENKFKVYISALTQLNIDEHNRIPTTDGRLLRRMARDARSRGTDARETIAMWPSVRRGEEQNIFPYQEDADVMFNSATIYELAVLKQFCEPILYTVPQDAPEYQEAKRLLKFLDYVLVFNSDLIPRNSLVREFMGGSCFDV